MSVTVSEKGWVVIPADLRKKYNLHPGAEVSVVDYGGVLALVPAMARPVRQAAGMLKGRPSLTRALLTEHRRERARSEEHTSELQSRLHLVCRLLLEKKKNKKS